LTGVKVTELCELYSLSILILMYLQVTLFVQFSNLN
jgi:hypothetical protein